jgi:hypothetical protein
MGNEPLSIRTTQAFALGASAWLSGTSPPFVGAKLFKLPMFRQTFFHMCAWVEMRAGRDNLLFAFWL